MDYNKEEAVRAKELAEEKMSAGDFVGAHKLVTKAQSLFPDLENILKMAAICDVHSSADKKIKGLDDWYGILQVQPFADAHTVKKRYRKLALLLHPDKNMLAGAEAAFKLVGEANRILSDQIKRSQYDVRYRSHSFLAKQSNANSGRQCSAAENLTNGYTFWTCCQNCGHRYKHLKLYVNKVMHCSTCQSSYIACNIGCDGVPPTSSTTGVKQYQDQWVYTSRQKASTGAESESSAAEMGKNETDGGKLNKKKQANQKRGAGDRKPKKDEACTENDTAGENPQTVTNNSAEVPKPDVMKPQPEVDETETSAAKSMPELSAPKKNQAAKKRRKSVEESSKSFEVAVAKIDRNGKSLRKKPQVSCAEGGSDCDFVSPPTKKTKSGGGEFESDSNTKQTAEDKKSPELADSGVSFASSASSHAFKGKAKEIANSGNEDILLAKNKESEGCDSNGADAALLSKIDKVENGYKTTENPNTLDTPDPESNVFEAKRKTENFGVDQVWSICDPRDGMPRKYARVRKVLDAEFKLLITCLVPFRKKNDESIHVACGMFKNGETMEIEDRSIFSGQMLYKFCNRNITIHPMKGEIWAVFRDWNEEWDTSLEKHKLPYKYDFVEIVNDYSDDVGIGVAYLGKLKGFVSRFHWEPQRGVCQIQFKSNEILRFSHRVPAVKMTGKEKECVPAVSYELDTAALPKDIPQADAVDMEMDSEILKGKVDGPYPEAPKVEVKAKAVAETAFSPKKRRKSDYDNGGCSNLGEVTGSSRSHDFSSCQVDEKNTPNESRKNGEAADVFKQRKSPRLQTVPSQQRDEKKSAKRGNTPKKTDKGCSGIRKPPNGIHQPAEIQEGESSKEQGRNCELPSLSKQNDLPTQLNGSTNDSPENTHVSSSCKTPRKDAFDFKNQRTEDKFEVDQIWAIYSKNKGLPTEYVKIKKINNKPGFRLLVYHMELYPPSTEPATRPVSCGDFKLKTKNAKILPRTSFSHQVNPVDAKKNMVKVYPRKGEIWALYKNCDSNKEEHDIVEVVEDYCDGEEIAKVAALSAKGSSSQFIFQRNSNSGYIDIPKAEMSNRFSHQIPAIRHPKMSTRQREGGYWELDPIAIAGRTIVLD